VFRLRGGFGGGFGGVFRFRGGFGGVFRFGGGFNYLEAVFWRRVFWGRFLGGGLVFGGGCWGRYLFRVVFENKKYQFEIYLLESVLQSFLTDGPVICGRVDFLA
jgi:hypothetical protein